MTATVLYFASLRDAAGKESESVEAGTSLATLYALLRARHGFSLSQEALRVAVDGSFARWDDPVADGAQIAFIPPVSGG